MIMWYGSNKTLTRFTPYWYSGFEINWEVIQSSLQGVHWRMNYSCQWCIHIISWWILSPNRNLLAHRSQKGPSYFSRAENYFHNYIFTYYIIWELPIFEPKSLLEAEIAVYLFLNPRVLPQCLTQHKGSELLTELLLNNKQSYSFLNEDLNTIYK